jgi:hypothetical protein
MKTYNESQWASSSYLLEYAADAIQQDTDTLEQWATRTARLVYAGGLEFFEAWDHLWFAAITGGLEQLVAQQRIGEAFASARQGVEVAA